MAGELAGVFMIWWDREMKPRMRNESIDVLMYKRYVNDITIVIKVKEDVDEQDTLEQIKLRYTQVNSTGG